MRCPYCGGVNADLARYCVRCGRSFLPPTSSQQPRQAPPSQGRQPAAPQRPHQQAVQAPPPTPRPPEKPFVPPVPPAPEPPAPFPSRTLEQLRALEPGALNYAVIDSAIGDGRKKTVKINYPRCVAWQQAATLLKALNEHQEERLNTIIIQGFWEQGAQLYAFTNGQLCFDRNVRLGSQITNRYLVETGNGFESDSVRVVLTEPQQSG